MPNQYDYSLQFFKRFYKPENTTILVVGDVKKEQVNELAEKYFKEWKKGNYNPEIPDEPEQKETRFAHVKTANFPAYLNLNFKGPAFDPSAPDNAALDIISAILFSKRSDLYKKLVVEEQKLRSLSGGSYYTRDPYLFSINASLVNEDDLTYIKDEISKALDNIKTNPVDQKLLDDTKSHLKYSFAMELDNPSSIAEALTYFIWVTGEPQSVNKLYKMYDKITPAQIQEVAAKYFKADKLTISTISSKEEGGVK
jgi:zinc protease